MKKIIWIMGVFLGLALLVCIIIGCSIKIPVGIPSSAIVLYKILTGFEYFLKILPTVIFMSFLIACSIYFGQNSAGSAKRFSNAMMDRYKAVMIIALMVSCLLTVSNEICGLLVSRKKIAIENQQKLITDYVKVGNNLCENGFYERAQRYADAALKLNPLDKDALALRNATEEEISRLGAADLRFRLYEAANETVEYVDRVDISSQQIKSVYECYEKSKIAYEKKEWFNAHYYAQLGIDLAGAKDPNVESLRELATSAWNNLVEYRKLEKNADQEIFEKKYQGYLALVEKDDLKAFYIFQDLYRSSRELQHDTDVLFYLEIAENRVNERCFFIDETLELESFESANNVYFANNYADGSKDIIYFEGMTTVKETGGAIQYLRNLNICTIEKNGQWSQTMRVPYAKVLPISVSSMSEYRKKLLGINSETELVPYIMLTSIDRNEKDHVIYPLYTKADGSVTNTPEFLLLPISYDEFVLMEGMSNNPNTIGITDLFRIIRIADKFGFSSQLLSLSFLNRLFYPFYILLLFLMVASFGWNNMINSDSIFQASWILAFPFAFAIVFISLQGLFFVFNILNYVIIANFGSGVKSIFASLVFYTLILVIDSFYFLSRSTRK